MRRHKIICALLVAFWLLALIPIGSARRILAHDYLHSLEGPTRNLPISTRSFALPILAADITQGLSRTVFYAYWCFVYVWPIVAAVWTWRANDPGELAMKWSLGISIYAVLMVSSCVLITFSLWLPFRN